MRWRRCWCGRATRRRPAPCWRKRKARKLAPGLQPDTNASPPPGHGRNGAEAFGGARKVDDCASELEAWGSLPGVRERQRIRAEGAEGAGADRGAGAAGGHGLLAGAVALRRLRAGVYGARAGRSGSGKVRRDGGGDDRATQVRQRNPVLPVGTTGRSAGDSVAGGDAVGDRRRGGRVDSNRRATS